MTVAMAPTNVGPQARALATRDFGEEAGGRWLIVLGVASLAVHAALFSALGRARVGATHAHPRPPAQVTMEVAPPRAPTPPKPMPPAEAPHPRAAIPKAKVAARPEPARVPPPPAAEPETPADFAGVTLTNDGDGAAWASAVGNGATMRGPVGAPRAKVTAREVAAPAPAAASAIVPLASLSRPPAPPDLAGMLERHYPEAARKNGQSGQAVLKARILPDGHARELVVVSESALGFGDACRATLRDSVWTPPLDRDGQPVATLINYTCRFEVR
jgi:outer membrane biosynthesis protein TonB